MDKRELAAILDDIADAIDHFDSYLIRERINKLWKDIDAEEELEENDVET